MLLQLALDLIDIDGAREILREVGDAVDIIEIGTPFILRDGIEPITVISEEFPSHMILADFKIMDGGGYESRLAFDAGADIVTVLAAAENITVQAVVKEARSSGKRVMADMIAVTDIEQRALELENLGVDYICVHTASDIQASGKNPLDELRMAVRVVKKAEIAVAGGINLGMIGDVVRYNPEIVIVGTGLTNQPDPGRIAQNMKALLNERE